MSIWHIILTADGRHPFFAREEDRRFTICKLARWVGKYLILFCLVDDHFHAVVFANKAKVGQLKKSIQTIIRQCSLSAVHPAHIRLVDTRSYMKWLVQYTLEQPLKHKLPVHPAIWTGSCFMDLIGARYLNGLHLRLGEALPRFRLQEAYNIVRLPSKELTLPTDEDIRRIGPYALSESAAAALCVPYPLKGKQMLVTMARSAICRMARDAGIGKCEVAHALGITSQAVGRLSAKPLQESVLRSVAMHLSLKQAVLQNPI